MSQQTNITPIMYKCPNGNSYLHKNNVDKYNFQLKYSPLAKHIDKNPGKFCYINDTKFGEVSGCSNETQKTNYTSNNIIQKISNDSFSRRNFVYDKNYVSHPPYYNMENPIQMNVLANLKYYDDKNLYKSYSKDL